MILKIQGIRSNHLLPLLIQASMWVYVVRVNIGHFFIRKPYIPFIKTCNHWSVVFPDRDTEIESIGKGVVEVDYSIEKHQYVKEWSIIPDDLEKVYSYCKLQENKGYEYVNFLFHILKIFGFRWLGSWNDNHHSCIELVNRALQIAGVEGINKFDNPYQTQVKLDKMFTGVVIKH